MLCNTLYFLVFRKELASLEEKYRLVCLKDEIQKKYFKREESKAIFWQVASAVESEQETLMAVNKQIQAAADEVRQRLDKRYIPVVVDQGIDEDLVRKAFNERFEDLLLRELREEVPYLLPPEQRGKFHDPDWDKRDDPVPVWITVVHLFFMGWTIINAHYPQLFIPGMLFFVGFATVTESFQNRVNLKRRCWSGSF